METEACTETAAASASSPVVSPEGERTLTCEEVEGPAQAGGSDSGVELGAGAPGGCDGYASGFESLVGGAASTSCESSLLSFSGDLENAISGLEDIGPRAPSGGSNSSRGRRTTTPGGTPTSRRSPAQQQQPASARNTSTTRRAEHKSTPNSTSSKGLAPRVPRRTEARSASRGRTPPVSTDDGRWPSVSIKPTRRSTGTTTTSTSTAASTERRSQRAATTPPEVRCTTFDKYATLPRRTRLAVTLQPIPSTTTTEKTGREPSLNRAASLRRQRVTTSGSSSGYRSDAEDASGSSVRSKSLTRTLPPYPRKRRSHNMRDASAQTIRDPRSREDLEARVERLLTDCARAQASADLAERTLQTERVQREALQQEAERVARRVATLLRGESNTAADLPPRHDWLAEIESRLSATSDVAARHQKELIKAQRHNRNLSEEVEKVRGAAQTARQQLADAEEEAAELQEFLAAEKSTLAESLREAEDKITSLMKQLEQKDKEIERQQDECRHLVRLSEQRRQEAEALKAQVSSTERLLVSQGGCTTAASVSLAGLCSRLESLLPQLNSPKEEVEIFLNEAYAPSVEASPENKRKTPTSSPVHKHDTSGQDDEELLSQVRSPAGLHAVEELENSPGKLANSVSLNDLTQAIISCHNCKNQDEEEDGGATLTDQASELDQLISKLTATFQSLLTQREQSVVETGQFKQKYESEHRALLEANSQLEEQNRRVRQLEQAQRIAQQAADETPMLRERLAEKDRELAEMNSKAAGSRQLLIANWRQAADELRRQYDAIDKALEVLHKEQNLVVQSPALSQLQQELEETNFHCVNLPSPLASEVEQLSPPLPSAQTNGVTDLLQSIHMPEAVNGTA